MALRPELGEGLGASSSTSGSASRTSSSSALGALQAIPGELTEAARVDGAGALQVFRKVTLPLLLVAMAPLLIASFAFNFNNFNNIYLLTGGGPYAVDQSIAGSTDILISYTYKLAFAAGQGRRYGLARAISIIIFFIVAAISAISFWRTKALEDVALTATRAHRGGSPRTRAARGGARRPAPELRVNWWRYLVGLARDRCSRCSRSSTSSRRRSTRSPSLASAQLIPEHVTLDNFRRSCSGHPGEVRTEQDALDVPYTTGT